MTSAPRRVFVSGIGTATPFGLGVAPLREALYAGRSAIAPIRSFDASRFPTRFGGELLSIRSKSISTLGSCRGCRR